MSDKQQEMFTPDQLHSANKASVVASSGNLAITQVAEEGYVEPGTYVAHEIDPARPFTAADQAALDQQYAQKREDDAAMRLAVEAARRAVPVPAEPPVLDSATEGRKVTSHLLRTGHFGSKRTPR